MGGTVIRKKANLNVNLLYCYKKQSMLSVFIQNSINHSAEIKGVVILKWVFDIFYDMY